MPAKPILKRIRHGSVLKTWGVEIAHIFDNVFKVITGLPACATAASAPFADG
jgi:hypothetical protein